MTADSRASPSARWSMGTSAATSSLDAAGSAKSASKRQLIRRLYLVLHGLPPTREQVEQFLDEGTFEETDALVEHGCSDFGMASRKISGDGVVAGHGRVHQLTGVGPVQDLALARLEGPHVVGELLDQSMASSAQQLGVESGPDPL